RTEVATPVMQHKIRDLLGRPPSLWEPAYRIFTVTCDQAVTGYVVVVEEIGKHRPITFAVGITPAGAVHDLAVLAYREAYGGEVRERRFLKQYARKTLADPLVPYRDVRNISGATLSVEATGRAARKAIAVLRSEEHTSELQSRGHLVCRLLLEKKKTVELCPCSLILRP